MSDAPLARQQDPAPAQDPAAGGHGGHRWMMIACCIPMIAIVLLLVATGVASAGVLVFALVCTLLMALMMSGMGHGGDKQRPHH